MRPDNIEQLFKDITYLKGVGPKLAEFLHKIGISKPLDLLWHFPRGFINREVSQISKESIGQIVTLNIRVLEHFSESHKRGKPYKILCEYSGVQSSGFIYLVYFNGHASALKNMYPIRAELVVSGKLEGFAETLQISHPDFAMSKQQYANIPKNEAVYSLTQGLSNRKISSLINSALGIIKDIEPSLPEWLDEALIKQRSWPSFSDAIFAMHERNNSNECSHNRLAYDEILSSQLALGLIRNRNKRGIGWQISASRTIYHKILKSLPFSLTADQLSTLAAIENDMNSNERMARLVQGDVGSGKTIVALLAASIVIESGGQVALMVPTGLLAHQHFEGIREIGDACGINVEILTGKDKTSERAFKLARLSAGEIDLLIGTHALFQDGVQFKNLRLAIVDEQHRFGVEQRLRLMGREKNAHMLMMSATPIPRSLTQAIYGDLDCSLILSKPVGRKPIDTRVMPLSRLQEIIGSLNRALVGGNKVYWVCPLVEESEELDLASVTMRFEDLTKLFPNRVGLVHGKIKPQERERILNDFAFGHLDILVATTVIEVGINVPSANLMVIEHAERFGLAQLHQLRGRVGRSDAQGICLLLYGEDLSESGIARLKIMRESNDGFRIAEEDLKIRGGGEVLGTKQSGMPEFRIFDFSQHREMISIAQSDAKVILHNDPKLESPRGKALKNLLYLFEQDKQIKYLKS